MDSQVKVQAVKIKNKGISAKVYEFVEGASNKPVGIIILCVLAFTEASFLPISPFLVLMAFCVAKPKLSMHYAGLTLVFTIAGGILGYYIGLVLFEFIGKPVLNFYGYWHYYVNLKEMLHKNEFLSLLIAGMTPIPFKVFSILSGSMSLNFWLFIAAAAISRGIKYYLFSFVIMIFGEKARDYIEKNIALVAILLILILTGLVLLIKFI